MERTLNGESEREGNTEFSGYRIGKEVLAMFPKPNDYRPMMNPDLSVCRNTSCGLLDPSKVAALFGYDLGDLAALLRATPSNLTEEFGSASIQEKLEPFDQVARYLGWCGNDPERFRAWLSQPNADFAPIDNESPSPRKLLKMGHVSIVAHHVKNLGIGQPS